MRILGILLLCIIGVPVWAQNVPQDNGDALASFSQTISSDVIYYLGRFMPPIFSIVGVILGIGLLLVVVKLLISKLG